MSLTTEWAPVDEKYDGCPTINFPPDPENSIAAVFDFSLKSERPCSSAKLSIAPPAVTPNLCNPGRPLSWIEAPGKIFFTNNHIYMSNLLLLDD